MSSSWRVAEARPRIWLRLTTRVWRARLQSREIPVISAVGHETDFTILDFVADLRAPTPSAAAELVIRSRQEVDEQFGGLQRRLEKAMRYHLLMARQNLTELAQHGAFARMMDLIHRREQRLDDLVNRLAHAQRDVFEKQRRRFETLSAAVRHYDVRRVLGGMKKIWMRGLWRFVSAARNLLLERKVRWSEWIRLCKRFPRWPFWSGVMRWSSTLREAY